MVTEEVLSTGEVPDIAAFVKASDFPSEAFVLVERFPSQAVTDPQERQNLLRFAFLADDIDLSLYTSGRVFHQDFELRWEQEAHRTRVVYLGKARNLPGLPPGKKLDIWETCEKSYYLFGKRLASPESMRLQEEQNSSYYAEVRIPRLLQYPVQAQQVQLAVREYVEKATGRVQLFRFLKLEAAQGSQAKEDEHESI